MTLGPMSTRKRWPLAIVALTLLVSAALAGCADAPEEQSEEDEKDPWNDGALSDPGPSTSTDVEAVLDAEAEGWAGENFTFDGSRSSATNGEIVMLRFDFGDGTTEETPSPDQAVVQHNYTTGGVYMVNLTVEAEAADGSSGDDPWNDDGNSSAQNDSGEQASDTTSLIVQVHERVEVEETELQAGLSPSTQEHAFSVQEDASSFNVTLQMESTHLLLDAQGILRVLDADGEALGEKGFNVSAGGNDTLRLTGSLNATGAHTLEVELETGDATYTGAIETRYEAET